MLPDFPNIKADVSNWATQIFKDALRAKTPLLSEMGRVGQHEGRRNSYEDEQGTIRRTTYKRMESKYFIRGDEIPATNLGDIRDRMVKVADDMARNRRSWCSTR